MKKFEPSIVCIRTTVSSIVYNIIKKKKKEEDDFSLQSTSFICDECGWQQCVCSDYACDVYGEMEDEDQ